METSRSKDSAGDFNMVVKLWHMIMVEGISDSAELRGCSSHIVARTGSAPAGWIGNAGVVADSWKAETYN